MAPVSPRLINMPGKHVRFAPDSKIHVFSLPWSPASSTPLSSYCSPSLHPATLNPRLYSPAKYGSSSVVLLDLIYEPAVSPAACPPRAVLLEPATNPPLPCLAIAHKRLPWLIRLAPSDPAVAYVTVWDVLYGISAFLHQPVTKAEYDSIPTGQAKSEVSIAYMRRYKASANFEAERAAGLKRVDFLLGRGLTGTSITQHIQPFLNSQANGIPDDAVSEPGFQGDFDGDFQTATTQPEAEEERAKHEVVSQAQEEERDVVLIIYPDADDCQGWRFLRQCQSIPTDTPRNV